MTRRRFLAALSLLLGGCAVSVRRVELVGDGGAPARQTWGEVTRAWGDGGTW